jgi:hypothetical protein
MNSHPAHTPATRSRLLKMSAAAAAGVVIAGVGGTVAATAVIVNHDNASVDGSGSSGNSGGRHSTPGLSGSNRVQPNGGSNGS